MPLLASLEKSEDASEKCCKKGCYKVVRIQDGIFFQIESISNPNDVWYSETVEVGRDYEEGSDDEGGTGMCWKCFVQSISSTDDDDVDREEVAAEGLKLVLGLYNANRHILGATRHPILRK